MTFCGVAFVFPDVKDGFSVLLVGFSFFPLSLVSKLEKCISAGSCF